MRFVGPECHCRSSMLFDVHPRLASIMFDVDCQLKRIGKEVAWTSIIREQSGDSGIHSQKRAADMSVKNLSDHESKDLVEFLNSKYTYDISRPQIMTAILNDGGNYAGQGSANHIHIQVAVGF